METNSTNSTLLSRYTLVQLNDEEFYRRLAPVVYLAVLMVIGIPGNLIVLVVYFRDFTRSTNRTFILVLATLDLSVCSISLPFEITEMRFQYMFYAVVACKLFRANNIFLTIGSMLTILSMSFERHRRICHPLRSQMTTRMCRISCLCIMLFSLALSSVNFVASGIRHVDLGHNLTGSDCSLDDSFVDSDFPLVLDAGLFLLAIGVFMGLLVVYSLIAKQIYKQTKFRRKFAVPVSTGSVPYLITGEAKRQSENDIKLEHVTINQECMHPCNSSLKNNAIDRTSNSGHSTNAQTICGNIAMPDVLDKVRQEPAILATPSKPTGHEPSGSMTTGPSEQESITSIRPSGQAANQPQNKGTTKVTKITFMISLVFVLSYLPYLLLSLVTSLKRGFVAEPGPIASAILPIVTRSIFMNNVANPLIYGFFDPKFRRSCKKLFKPAFGC
ncbi:alpha-2A adrenergic receptor-like [Argopecten irradians]|uniref:alpha-2A adrenergic receptor-like n=1 Tax=Argopecten irradians TaxID=31199 RepID=UPI0037177CE5